MVDAELTGIARQARLVRRCCSLSKGFARRVPIERTEAFEALLSTCTRLARSSATRGVGHERQNAAAGSDGPD